MVDLTVFLFLALFIVQVTSKCPNGWMPYDHSCYRLFENKVTWPIAQFECETHNGYLVMIDSKKENDNVHSLMKDLHISNDTNIWIGLADMRNEGVFVWENAKQEATFTDWAPTQPNQHLKGHNNEDCVMLIGRDGHQWADAECQHAYSYLCERHRDTPID